LRELTDKKYGEQIQEAIDKAAKPELCGSIFTRPVFYHLFTDLLKAGPFGNNRNVAVHFTIHFNPFDYLPAISFQPAVKIMQIMNPRHPAGYAIEQFGGNGLGQRIMALPLPSRNKVKFILGDFSVQLRDLIRTILKV